MIAMMMGVKNILYRLLGCLLDIRQTGLCATWKIGIHDNQIIFHLNPNVVAVTFVFKLALTKPNPWGNEFHLPGGRLSFMMRRHQPGNS